MLRCRFFEKSAISSRSLPLPPDWWSLLRSPFIQTESKAFSKSMETTAPFCLFLLTSWQHNFSLYISLTVLRCDWKPSLLSFIILLIRFQTCFERVSFNLSIVFLKYSFDLFRMRVGIAFCASLNILKN